MRITVKNELIDVKSTEMKKLYLRIVYIGEYSYGDYSKLVRIKANNNHFLGSFENYICGLIHNYFKIDVLNENDVKNAINLCKEKEQIELIDWINQQLYVLIKDYKNYEN